MAESAILIQCLNTCLFFTCIFLRFKCLWYEKKSDPCYSITDPSRVQWDDLG
jgi:hypothetical protein